MLTGKFRRSETFPAPPTSAARSSTAKTIFRTRCVSLPVRAHPLAAHLAYDLNCLRSWPSFPSVFVSDPDPSASLARSISDGLERIRLLLIGLADALPVPQARAALLRTNRSCPVLAAFLLDDFLRLADVYGSFRLVTTALRHHLAVAQSALRRHDEPRLAASLRDQRRAGKDLADLAASSRAVIRQAPQVGSTEADADVAEVSMLMWEISAAVAEASAAVFLGVRQIASLAAAEVAPSRFPWAAGVLLSVLRWRARARARARAKSIKKKELPQENRDQVARSRFQRTATVLTAVLRWRARARANSIRKESPEENGSDIAAASKAGSSRLPWAAAVLRWRARAKARAKPAEMKTSPDQEKGNEVEAAKEERRRTSLERLGAAEEAIASLEGGVVLVFRSVVDIRVALLQILPPGISNCLLPHQNM
ncbi:hypothetical protein ZIOFF_058205 [Zingiber officinale]|uniref:Uncharacterized protein n=1 Tax=Zingiber officinale TaxID=94328 RepID=A0A8J5F4H8_ZINOF|nr:hypothetical protein ZIOFF_058205 [Zingiber officinale]